MISTILFDFGNVLYWFDYGKFFSRLRRYSSQTEEQMRNNLFGGPNSLAHQFETGRMSSSQFVASMMKATEIQMHESEFIQAFIDIFAPNQPVIDLARRLSEHSKIALISNTNELHYKHFMSLTPIHSLFSQVSLSYEVGVMKPNEKIYLQLLDKLNCSPSECVLIDDLPDNIATGKSLGLATIHYSDQTIDLAKHLAKYNVVTNN